MYNCSVMLGTEWFSYKFNKSVATLHQFKELLFNSMLMKRDFWHVFCDKHNTFDDTKRTKNVNLRQNKVFHFFDALVPNFVENIGSVPKFPLKQNFHDTSLQYSVTKAIYDVPGKPSKLYFACCAMTLHIIMWSTCPCSYVRFST